MKNYITVAAFLAAGAAFANADVNAVVLTPTGPGETREEVSGIIAEDVQIGAASDGAGNFAAVKFAMDAAGTATLTFDYAYDSKWGRAQDLVFDYDCTVYGFTEDGRSTLLAAETFIDGVTVSAVTEGETGNLSLSFAADASYAAYGVIFNAREAGGSNGGVAVSIDNVQVSYSAIPEPSAFGLLAGLGALALVASRRRRK